MRISTTQLESYRLWRNPEQDWMSEDELHATIRGEFVPNHKVLLGSAFGKILEDPDRYLVPGGFEAQGFGFDRDVIEPCLAVIDRRGIFEAKSYRTYDDCDVVARADHMLGAHLSEFKTTLSSFDIGKYMDSFQWRFMLDIFRVPKVTYHVFCLSEAPNGVISLRSIETFNLFTYDELHDDCLDLLRDFKLYVRAAGLESVLKARQAAA